MNSRLYRQFSTTIGFPKPDVAVPSHALPSAVSSAASSAAWSAVALGVVGLAAPTRAMAQSFPQRLPPAIPVPLPSRSGPSLSADTPLIPTERELLESFAPGSGFGSPEFSSLGPSSGPLQVPDIRIPIGNAGNRSDVSSFTAAQMPWNENPARQRVGGGGAQFPGAPAFKAPSPAPSTLFPQLQTSRPQQPSFPPVSSARALPGIPRQSPQVWSQPAALGRPTFGQPAAFNPAATASPSPWRYRLFVALPPQAAQANQIQAQLRLWVNDAFVTVVRGQRVLQLGNFRDRDRANLMFEQLRRLGFWPQIEVTTQ